MDNDTILSDVPQFGYAKAGNTTNNLAPFTSELPAQFGYVVVTAPPKPPPPIPAEGGVFEGKNLGEGGPGSIDGRNRQDKHWWLDAGIAKEILPVDPASIMGKLLDRIERLEDWRDSLDDKIARYNKGAAHRIL